MVRRFVLCGACLVAVSAPMVVAGTPAVGQVPRAHAASTTVTVIATEFKFRLSTSTVRKGTVVFKVENKGHLSHDFKINGKKTPLIKPGKARCSQSASRRLVATTICAQFPDTRPPV